LLATKLNLIRNSVNKKQNKSVNHDALSGLTRQVIILYSIIPHNMKLNLVLLIFDLFLLSIPKYWFTVGEISTILKKIVTL